jgi:hypothetical protein
MTEQLRRPLVVGGVLLALAISILDILSHLLGEVGGYLLVAGAIGTGIWWLQQRSPQSLKPPAPATPVDLAMVQRTLSEAERVITQLETEASTQTEPAAIAIKPQLPLLQLQIAQIAQEVYRQELRLVVLGGKGSGKTALVQLLQADWVGQISQKVRLAEAPSFSAASVAALSAERIALQQARAGDLVLFLVTGDLTESELQIVKQLVTAKRTVLLFSKQDQHPPEERQMILGKLQERVQGILPGEDVVAIAAAPNPIKVRQHQEDGSVNEWMEEQNPVISTLTQRLNQILSQESQQLVLASSLSHAIDLKTQANTALNDLRRIRAMPLVEQFQWISAATAFASPLPTLDVLATAAINAQMILDLGAIYQQRFSLQQAQKVATTLGSLMLKLGLVELSTRVIAGFLKSNAVTYVAGGCLQGISAAYLTRLAGLSLIEYFHSQEPNLTPAEAPPLAIERFSHILQAVFQGNQQLTFLQGFVTQAINHLTPVFQSTATPAPSIPHPPSPIPDSPSPELQLLDENGTGVRLSLPSLDSTTFPSP